MLSRGAWAEVDLGAIGHNYRAIRSRLRPETKLCAVVKANGYGHGAIPLAKTALACGADYLAVATLSEAIELRGAGFTSPILLLGLVPPEYAADCVNYDLTLALATDELAAALSAAATSQGRRVKVHLKVDTGMGRIGVKPGEIGRLAAKWAELPGLDIEGIFSHFAQADTGDKSYTMKQLAKFQAAIAALEAEGIKPHLKHIAESAAILEIPAAHFDMVRAGIIQYGLWPSVEVSRPVELKGAMKLLARIAFLKTIDKGESIGYGGDFIATRPSLIATLPLGYADGYIRAYAAKGRVEIRGRSAPIAGRICMDQTMVDVTDIPGVKLGDTATLFGSPTLTIDEVAGWANTINYEVPCLLSPRVPRMYV